MRGKQKVVVFVFGIAVERSDGLVARIDRNDAGDARKVVIWLCHISGVVIQRGSRKTLGIDEIEVGVLFGCIVVVHYVCVKHLQKLSGQIVTEKEHPKTEEDREMYITQFEKVEGIKLDRNSIQLNSPMRLITKLANNSSWGKFAQNQNKPNTVVLNTASKLFELLHSKEIKVNSI